MVFLRAFAPCLLLLLPQLAADTTRERVRVDWVLVEIVARDSHDQLVTDLTASDFVVRDDGQKVDVESLDILDLRGDAGAGVEIPVVDAGAPRLLGSRVILVVDFQFADHRGVNETFRRLDDYLAATTEQSGLSYLVYSLEGGALMDDFAADPSVARDALRDYRGRYEERRQGLRRDDEIGDLQELERTFGMCPSGPGYAECIRVALDAFLAGQNARTETILRELEGLVDRYADGEHRQSLVLISPGFSLHPGSAGVQLAAQYLGQGGGADLASRIGGGLPGTISFEKRFDEIVAACARNRVVFHGFDIYNANSGLDRKMDVSIGTPPGTGVVSSYDSYEKELQRGMRDLARDTGGVFQVYLDKMRPVLEGDRFVYVLGYPRPEREGTAFRKLKVKCKRKGVRLRHRSGYVG